MLVQLLPELAHLPDKLVRPVIQYHLLQSRAAFFHVLNIDEVIHDQGQVEIHQQIIRPIGMMWAHTPDPFHTFAGFSIRIDEKKIAVPPCENNSLFFLVWPCRNMYLTEDPALLNNQPTAPDLFCAEHGIRRKQHRRQLICLDFFRLQNDCDFLPNLNLFRLNRLQCLSYMKVHNVILLVSKTQCKTRQQGIWLDYTVSRCSASLPVFK